jgi:hypothetical protein
MSKVLTSTDSGSSLNSSLKWQTDNEKLIIQWFKKFTCFIERRVKVSLIVEDKTIVPFLTNQLVTMSYSNILTTLRFGIKQKTIISIMRLSKMLFLQKQENEKKNSSYLPLTKQKGNGAMSNTFSFECPLPRQLPFSTPPAVLWLF